MSVELLYGVLSLSVCLFALGLLALMLRRNFLLALLGVEMLINAGNLNFLAFARYHNDATGAMFVLFGICLAAVEAVIGLALAVRLFRAHETLGFHAITSLRW